jgi:sugar/nucleoside kinase (ribokinase family)
MKLDVVGIGSPFIDIFHTPSGMQKSPGQIVVNTILVIQRLGLKTGLIGRVGSDENGAYIRKVLDEEGVDISGLSVDNYPTTQLHIEVVGGERCFIAKKFNRPLKELGDRDKEYLGSAGSVFVRERNPVFPSVAEYLKGEYLKRKYLKLFLSLHDFRPEGIDMEFVKESRPAVIFANREEFGKIKKEVDYFTGKNTKVVVTEGERGCSVYTESGIKRYPGFKVKPADTTGSGDAFAGGFIFGELSGWELGKTAGFANALGALTVMHFGASQKAFSLRDVTEFIESRGMNLNYTC